MSDLEQQVIDLGKQRDQLERKNAELKSQLAALDSVNEKYYDLYRKCFDQRNELAAHFERLHQDAYQKTAYMLTEYGIDGDNCKRIAHWIKDQSPKTSLAEHNERLLRDFVNGLLGDKEVNANQVAEFGKGLPTVYIRKVDILNYLEK